MLRGEVAYMAGQLLQQHGLYQAGWRFQFDSGKRRVGCCKYRHKLITYSEYFINRDENDIRNTILHEIAHAIAGAAAKHGYVWQNVCRQIGARPERCAEESAIENSLARPNYYLICSPCNVKHPMYRRPRCNYVCRSCKTILSLTVAR